MKKKGFYFNPQMWLGNANIMTMDWDCRGMLLHLMAFSWQQNPVGHILYDESLLLRLLGNPDKADWDNRIKPQLEMFWSAKEVDGVVYWVNEGLIELSKESEAPVVKPRKRAAKKTAVPKEDLATLPAAIKGADINLLLDLSPSLTIAYERHSKEDSNTIWNIGVNLLSKEGDSEKKVRGFIARLVKTYGEKEVASALLELSLRNKKPVEINSYLVGMLKNQASKQEKEVVKKNRRGMVSL